MDSKLKRHILVVDDDAAMRKVLSLGLEKSGFGVTVARDGREALDALDSGTFDSDCVLLDIRMPVMTGREALPHIKKRNPTVPVIMLTAFNDLSNGVDSMRDGAFDYLVKPVRLEELLQVIERAFSHRALLMENAELCQRNEEYRLQLELKVEARTMALNEAYVKLRRTNMETVRVLAETIEAKDQYTRGHCQRVRLIAVGIARVLGLSARNIEILEYSSLLHDIGKIGIPESLLNKSTKLEPEEFEIIRQHPATGAQILSHVEFFAPCLPSVRQHHERWDGKG
jgi:putative two-component system response regulator